MIALNKKLANKLSFEFRADYFISFVNSDWFYVIPTLKINILKNGLEVEIDWLSFCFYVGFTKIKDD